MNLNRDALKKALMVGAGAGLLWAVGRNIPLLNTIFCCIGWVAWLAVGAAYGYFHQKTGGSTDSNAIIGGLITGLVTALVWGIAFTAIAVALSLLGITVQTALTATSEDMMGPLMAGMSTGMIQLVFTAMWAIAGMIWIVLVSAVGGLLFMALGGGQRSSLPVSPQV